MFSYILDFFQLIKSFLPKLKLIMLLAPSCTVQVNRLMEKVEHAFIKHFANGNHRKGMNTLRPTAKRERHRITFLLGKGTKKCIWTTVNIEKYYLCP